MGRTITVAVAALALIAGFLMFSRQSGPDGAHEGDGATSGADAGSSGPAGSTAPSEAPRGDGLDNAGVKRSPAPASGGPDPRGNGPLTWADLPDAMSPGESARVAEELRAWVEEQGMTERGVFLGEPDCSEAPCVVAFGVDVGRETTFADRRAFLAEARARSGFADTRLYVTGRTAGRESSLLYWNPDDLPAGVRDGIEASVSRRGGAGVTEEDPSGE